jgi:CheY-like chemotaxis protein
MAKILVVDDEPDSIEVLEWFLSDRGHQVRTAESGTAALDVAERYEPDVLIIDYFLLDELNGVEVAKRLRERNSELRVLLVTGMVAEELDEACAAVGDIHVLRKPVDLATLGKLIEHRP